MKMKEAKIIENMVNVGKIALTAAIASLAVAGCGYDSANDSVAPTAASANTVDISAMMNTALSGLAASNRVASVGDGCVAELTIDTALQRNVSEILARNADTNDTGIGWAILLSVEDGAVLALADCGSDNDAPRPFALTRMFMPGHLLSTLTVAAAIDTGVATPDTQLFTNTFEAYFSEYYFDRYIASFAGFFPADAPQYVLVVCYETKRIDGVPYIHQGGGRPAMAFAEVVRRMGYGKQKNRKQ